jgi:hypothetical protein
MGSLQQNLPHRWSEEPAGVVGGQTAAPLAVEAVGALEEPTGPNVVRSTNLRNLKEWRRNL